MKILLFGCAGQVGGELQRTLSKLGELIAVDIDSIDLCGDFRDLKGIENTVRTVKPDVIVNAAAYTDVDRAEYDRELANVINVLAPAVLASAAKRINAWLIHYSTDYVFDGSGEGRWCETDQALPLNVYGVTKLDADMAIQISGCKYLIFRTSWLYSTRPRNFIFSVLAHATELERFPVVTDQIGAPTGANLIARGTLLAIRAASANSGVNGLYHFTADGFTSRYAYAKYIIDTAINFGLPLKCGPDSIQPVLTATSPTGAARPLNCRLSTDKFKRTFGITLPTWQSETKKFLYSYIHERNCLSQVIENRRISRQC